MVDLYRRRFEHYGHGTADQAIVGLGGQVFMRKNSQDAVNEFRPYFDNAPVYGHGPSLEDFTRETPLTVGSPQQVIERTLGFRDYVGDYQRQLFLMDHAGLPLKTVLEQLDLLGEEVVPVLRREFAALKPAHVPDAPTHASPARRARRRGRRRVGRAARPTASSSVEPSRPPRRPHDDASSSISAGLSVPSSTRILADSLAAATQRALAALGQDCEVDVVELRDLAHLITDNQLTGFPTGALADAVRRVAEADAVIAVTPVFSASYSGLFKTFFDVLEDGALEGKPVLVAATAGTARHSLVLDFAMRPLFAYLRADVVPTGRLRRERRLRLGFRRYGGLALRSHRPRRRRARRPGAPPRLRPPGRPLRRPDTVRGPAQQRLTRTPGSRPVDLSCGAPDAPPAPAPRHS